MPANDSTPAEGKGAAESIDYDRERRLWRFIDDHADLLADLAQQAKQDSEGRRLSSPADLEEAAEQWRELSREAAFLAEIIEKTRPRNPAREAACVADVLLNTRADSETDE